MADMLIDDVKLTACLDAEADAIRAKTGDSTEIPFDYANNKGFADAIAAISGGGGRQKVLLASGTYTLASQNTYMSIPISYTGTATEGSIIGEAVAGTACTYATYILNDIQGNDDNIFAMPGGSPTVCMNVAQTSGNVKVPGHKNNALESERIYMYANSGTYPLLAGTYNWYVWGYAS